MKQKIVYVWDPLCGWCYGFEPQMEKFQAAYGEQYEIEVLVGGMVLPPNGRTMGQMKSFLEGAIPQLEKTTGVEISQKYYENILTQANLTLYSVMPAQVFHFLAPHFKGKEVSLARKIQDLLYKEGLNTNELPTYQSLIESCGLSFDRSIREITSKENLEATYHMFKKARELGVTGYPAVLLAKEKSHQSLSRGYTTFEKLKKQL